MLALLLAIGPSSAWSQAQYPPLPPEALPGLLASEFVKTSNEAGCRDVDARPPQFTLDSIGGLPQAYYRIGINGDRTTLIAGFAGLNEVRVEGTLAISATAPGTAQYRSLADCGYYETTIIFAGPPWGDGKSVGPLTVTYPKPTGTRPVDATVLSAPQRPVPAPPQQPPPIFELPVISRTADGVIQVDEAFTVKATLRVKSWSGPPSGCIDNQPAVLIQYYYPKVQGNSLIWKQMTPRGRVVATGTIRADGSFEAVADQSTPPRTGFVVERYAGRIDPTGRGTLTYTDKVGDCTVVTEGPLEPVGIPIRAADGRAATAAAPPDLAVKQSLRAPPGAAQPGTAAYQDRVTFVLTVTNVGGTPAPGPIVVRDALPAGLIFVAAKGENWRCSSAPVAPNVPVAGSVVSCRSEANLEPNASLPDITVEASVGVKTNKRNVNLVNQVLVDYPDGNPANNRADQQVTLKPLPDLSVLLVHAPSAFPAPPPPAPPGTLWPFERVAFTITVTNVGTEPAPGPVPILQTLPPGLTWLSVTTPAGGGWQCSGPNPRSTAQDTQELRCINQNAGGLPVGASLAPIGVTASVQDKAESVVTLDYPDFVDANNTATDAIELADLPDLSVRATHEGEFDPTNSEIITLVVKNQGDGSTIGPTTLDLELSGGLSYRDLLKGTEGIDSAWSCATVDRQKVSCTNPLPLFPVLPGTRPDTSVTTLPIETEVSLVGDSAELPTLRALVTTPGDTEQENNQAEFIFGPRPDIAVGVTDEGELHPGGPDLITVSVRNIGERSTLGPTTLDLQLASEASLSDLVPSAEGIDAGWSCAPDEANRQISCTNGGILDAAQTDPPVPDPSVTKLRLRITVAPSLHSRGKPTLSVLATTPYDANPDNNAAEVSVPPT